VRATEWILQEECHSNLSKHQAARREDPAYTAAHTQADTVSASCTLLVIASALIAAQIVIARSSPTREASA
jgi:hypothetical protein